MLPKEETRQLVQQARVRIVNGDFQIGCGVLANGKYILTAAHCANFTSENAKMADAIYQQDFLMEIETEDEQRFRVEPVYVEFVSDLAVFGWIDSYDPDHDDDREDFDRFTQQTRSLSFANNCDDTSSVYILTHEHKWISGIRQQSAEPYRLRLQTKDKINHGTSGSPIVNAQGQLVAITSLVRNTGGNFASYGGVHPVVPNSLPTWLIEST